VAGRSLIIRSVCHGQCPTQLWYMARTNANP